MEADGQLGREHAELLRRGVKNGVSKFLESGAIIPEMEEHTRYDPRVLMSPEPKLLHDAPGSGPSALHPELHPELPDAFRDVDRARQDAERVQLEARREANRVVPEARGDGRDFEHWFAEGLGRDAFGYRVVRVDRDEEPPPIDSLAGGTTALVTGSPAMVSDRAAWSERTAEWLAEFHASGRPLLGVCYGHQLVAHALGGSVGPNPNGRAMGRIEITVTAPDDALLGRFAPACAAHVSHLETVLDPPPSARTIATAPHDPYHALYFGNRSWGIQFHPEFDARIMRDYLRARADVLADEGRDPDALLAALRPDHAGPAVLKRFAELVLDDGIAGRA